MDFFIKLADGFMGMFQEGAEVLMGFITGIIPLLIVLITIVNAFIKIVGEDRIFSFMKAISKITIFRYTLIPFFSVFFLTNPMCYTFGKFLPEKQKPAFYDSAVSFVHPITGLFPHANSAELFIFLGIAQGFAKVGSQSRLALMYLIVGLIVCLVRGVVTEKITDFQMKRNAVAKRNVA
ncbi:PTS glucitol/sorbitol transporter subunit IIC [Metabacillus arenae]|uniref:PTS glucitol/sorbitol transporter subunit IIC n=1 Tax=Metabacillus arenae TaxID=2771434 RepID=A0A926S036_9BACI|nr:PTS glucitol/sorbitol transporter subunit IIC [Metabacillus arenae]MBD1383495.1 PTS glucitol/sorbitol transporter subunit IIC [Metabacillus arenae]